MNLCQFRFFLALSLVGILPVARAELATFTVDPALSSVTLSGSISGATLLEQSPGSLTTTYEGALVVDVSATGIKFVGGSVLGARELRNMNPGPNGAVGSAPASYGAMGTLGSGLFSVSATAATRRVAFDVTSNPLIVTGGAFDSKGLNFRFVDTNNAVLDYRATGILSSSGSKVLGGLATNNATGASTLVSADGVETLTIAVKASYVFGLLLAGDTVVTFTGQFVAKRGGNTPPPPVVAFVPPLPGASEMTLTWSPSYKLQRATQVSPPDWGDVAAPSPLAIPFLRPGEFFRVVPK